ncbi:MAG: hypothetical protein O4808_05950 [Trichodesmium sp. St17_bin3_1_1]|nr:hypothetical protein [Trichodesmium sp. St18_bin1]MDE5106615.1 hypothetical protein [Trichodesmium sp. St17_bin3_1_1]
MYTKTLIFAQNFSKIFHKLLIYDISFGQYESKVDAVNLLVRQVLLNNIIKY